MYAIDKDLKIDYNIEQKNINFIPYDGKIIYKNYGLFLSARKNGCFSYMKWNKEWEQFSLVKYSTEEEWGEKQIPINQIDQ